MVTSFFVSPQLKVVANFRVYRKFPRDKTKKKSTGDGQSTRGSPAFLIKIPLRFFFQRKEHLSFSFP